MTTTTGGQLIPKIVLKSFIDIKIRRLTPGECWKLQGFTDEDISKVKPFVSDHQMYRQAGNAVTVNVAEMIGKAIVSAIERNKLN